MTDISRTLVPSPQPPRRMSAEMAVAYVLLALALLFWGAYSFELFSDIGMVLG